VLAAEASALPQPAHRRPCREIARLRDGLHQGFALGGQARTVDGRLLKVAIEGLHVVHPLSAPAGPTATDVEAALRRGSPQQRLRLLNAIRELSEVVDDVRGVR
jgi:hypothetical protein